MSAESNTKRLKGKRKKVVPKNANPLFTQWLMEWKEEAVERGWKSAHTYNRALKTLLLFPLPLPTGKDCKLLQNFGDKICRMLDEKLEQYRQNNVDGLTSSTSAPVDHQDHPPTKVSTQTHHSHTVTKPGPSKPRPAQATPHTVSDDSDTAQPSPRKKRKQSGTRSREYIPTYRSGPYALLLTLYRCMQDSDFKGFMTKNELAHAAQHLSDKSFITPDPGSRYTAWSSMSTLIKKGLISKCSSPAKFSLTDEGYTLAQRLSGAEQGSTSNQVSTDSQSQIASGAQSASSQSSCVSQSLSCGSSDFRSVCQRVPQSVHNISSSDDDDDDNKRSAAPFTSVVPSVPNSRKNPGVCKDILISSDDEDYDIIKKTDSNTNLSHKLTPEKVVQAHHSLSSSPRAFPTLTHSNSASSLENASTKQTNSSSPFENVNEVLEISDGEDNDPINPAPRQPASSLVGEADSEDELPDLDLPLSMRLLQRGSVQSQLLGAVASSKPLVSTESVYVSQDSSSNKFGQQSIASLNKCVSKSSSKELGHQQESSNAESLFKASTFPRSSNSHDENSDYQVVHQTNYKAATYTSTNSESVPTAKSRIGSYTDSGSILSSTASTCTPLPATPEFTLLPGSYDIVLCLDNREFYGKKSSSKTLLPELMKAGIECDLRLLHVGDLLWIAKERVPQTQGIQRVQGRELVLDFAIERKRMDDLVSSMTDGRMKEQKFRLRHCGLKELIILIEEYGSIQNFSLSESTIMQSIVNSQIIDGFKVKRCGGTKDAVVYLAHMTRFLQQHYKNKTLHAVSLDQKKNRSDQGDLLQQHQYLMPFYVFNEASIKHKDLTVKELFAKQLIQVPGISADRAKAITMVYPTPTLLLNAFKSCSSNSEREKLLANIKCGKNCRNLGSVLSKLLSMLYTDSGPLL